MRNNFAIFAREREKCMMDAENTLKNIIAEAVRKKINELLSEGIDIDNQNNVDTIKETCRIMKESYAPKSITVLTLLSRL